MSVNKVNSDGSLLRVAGGTLYADLPIASEIEYAGTTPPNGFLACDGSAITQSDYPELYAIIGGTLPSKSGYIIKAKQVAVPTDIKSAVDDMLDEVMEVIPSEASASNQLVTQSNNNFKYTDLGNPTTAVDANTITTTGVYSIYAQGGYHFPFIGWNMLYVTRANNSSSYVQQICIDIQGVMYKRTKNANTWSSWQKLVTESDLTSSVTSGSKAPITSGGVYDAIHGYHFTLATNSSKTVSGADARVSLNQPIYVSSSGSNYAYGMYILIPAWNGTVTVTKIGESSGFSVSASITNGSLSITVNNAGAGDIDVCIKNL